MALVTTEIARCGECGKFGPMMFTNHMQTQIYCDICQPIVEQRTIDEAIITLMRKKVTPEMYERFWKRLKK